MSIELEELRLTCYGKQYLVYPNVAEDHPHLLDSVRIVPVARNQEEWHGTKDQVINMVHLEAFRLAEAFIENIDGYIPIEGACEEPALLVDHFDTEDSSD